MASAPGRTRASLADGARTASRDDLLECAVVGKPVPRVDAAKQNFYRPAPVIAQRILKKLCAHGIGTRFGVLPRAAALASGGAAASIVAFHGSRMMREIVNDKHASTSPSHPCGASRSGKGKRFLNGTRYANPTPLPQTASEFRTFWRPVAARRMSRTRVRLCSSLKSLLSAIGLDVGATQSLSGWEGP